ncbi:M20/M25/M40 family metallo-hydrolase [Natranaeroarchaeum sulfidigenes]|uniref:Acetylornithine deacetylase/Succinyl-diaminopimelate desuccinylase or related deacylase n=1 Tax=Natranaeroarchaeum sulfidigenes TaxID=2784880 RepID=A0A897MSM1_9EURY|nr:M20/M25/M40 family metallo-hydrolase [Natranaeroarchaeum sulfidigenes]QSG03497.1 Acetylornithine deacetylase/Succinyl-diaminopimelate desuccinylase or related deacylase [Natranaeroarchaeum sulfidigenes]
MSFDIERFHADAVQTPSHESVAEMRELLVEQLRVAGHEPEVDDLGNVVATRGADAGPHIVLNTHMDTVPPHLPYDRDGDIVHGRGACDAKGPLAALLAAFLEVKVDGGRLTLAITPDEETTQTGAKALSERLDADAYIVGEPTGLDVCIGARGQCEGRILIEGESGHAADVDRSRNPIHAVATVLRALETYDEAEGPDDDPVLGEPKLTPTVLAGGNAPNRVPDRVTITFDRRNVPPETSETFAAGLQTHLDHHLTEPITARVELIRPDTPFPDPFVTDEEAPLVERLRAASGGEVRAFGAATEASYFARDAPTVVFGPGVLADEDGAVAHSEREYVSLEEVHAASDAVTETVESLLGE